MTRAAPRTREDDTMTATAKREAPAKGKVGAKAAPEEDAKGKKKGGLLKNKKFLILLVLVLVVGGAAYKMLMPAPKPGPPAAGDTVVLDPLTLNLTDGHYLQVAVAIDLVQGKATKDKFEVAPADQAIIDEFSNRTVASLSSRAARTASLKTLIAEMKKEYPGMVFDAHFTKFVTQ
jgi:flagellar protein FliL